MILSPPNSTTSLLFPQSSKQTCNVSSLIRRPQPVNHQSKQHYRATGRRCRYHSGAPPQPQAQLSVERKCSSRLAIAALLHAHNLLDVLTETRDDAVAALLLFLKPAFVPCTFLAGSNLAALPIFQLRPSILDQGHAHQVLDTMCQPSCDLLPCCTCRRNAWMATTSHATVDRQQLGRRLKGAGCRSCQGAPSPLTRVVVAVGNVYIQTKPPLPFVRFPSPVHCYA
jgi:hypothetical protein